MPPLRGGVALETSDATGRSFRSPTVDRTTDATTRACARCRRSRKSRCRVCTCRVRDEGGRRRRGAPGGSS